MNRSRIMPNSFTITGGANILLNILYLSSCYIQSSEKLRAAVKHISSRYTGNKLNVFLTQIWVGFLGVPFAETWKLEIWYANTHIYLVSENIPLSTKTSLILLMSAFFFCKNSTFFKNSTFIQQYESCVRDFLVLFSVFVSKKVTINENVNFTDHASGIWLPDCSKLSINRKNNTDVTVC